MTEDMTVTKKWSKMHLMVSRGDLDAIKKLLSRSSKRLLYTRTRNVMQIAAWYGHSNVLDFLLRNYPELLKHRTYNGITVLQCAVKNRQEHIVTQLFDPKYDLLFDIKNVYNAFCDAMRNKSTAIMILILKNYHNILYKLSDDDNSSILHLAVCFADTEFISYLIQNHGEYIVGKRTESGDTALHIAVRHPTNALNIVQLLFEANPNTAKMSNYHGITPFMAAISMGVFDVYKYLFTMDPNLLDERRNAYNILGYACDVQTFDWIIQKRPHYFDEVCPLGETILHKVVSNGNPDLISHVLKLAPNLVDNTDKKHNSPLRFAMEMNSYPKMCAFLKFRPDLIANDIHKNTVLHIVTEHCDHNMIALVLESHHFELNHENYHGQTPLDVAVEKRDKYLVELFQIYVTIELAKKAQDVCLKDLNINLGEFVLKQLSDLNTFYLLPPLIQIILSYF